MNYLIDTNVVSETFKPRPNVNVIKWFEATLKDTLFISVLTLGEIRSGIERLPESKKKATLIHWLEHDLCLWFGPRLLNIDQEVADKWGCLYGQKDSDYPAIDSLIAATALTHQLTLVTRNTRDFDIAGLSILNPWDPLN